MARFPDVSAAGAAVPASIFARLREHLARYPGDVIPLQIGDTYLPPPAGLADAISDASDAELYTYGAPHGHAPLLETIAERHGVGVDHVQIAMGTTQALAATVGALCDPGDELIMLTPHWPLIRGIALAAHVVPVEVIAHGSLPTAELVARIAAAITPRTTAIYFATPNNPDGEMLSREQLAAIATLAEQRGLWLIADEVYEHYTYDAAHASIAAIAPARTVSTYSFAKSYAQAGLRVGYAVGPAAVMSTMRKLINHGVYNVPVAAQRAAVAAMRSGDRFLADARGLYRAARDATRARLKAPAALPPGGAYLWVDFGAWSGDDCMPVLENCAAAGVLLAPGSAFGAACERYARLCFTGVSPTRLAEGVDRINAVLETMPRREG
ncbi:MAG TPA: pyridoxal phosphate-dependent aminotransferase [Kofleriaceae bacterium]